jgi:phosphatidylglycerophosphate synthase
VSDPAPSPVVDARDPLALTELVGIPLIARHVRVAARAGAREVLVLGDPAAVGAALARRPPPEGVTVRVEARAPAAGEAAIDARGVTGAGGAGDVLMTLGSAADRAEAERRLFASLRKSVARDGVVSYYVARPMIRPLVRLLLPTRVAPNHVTVVSLVCGILAGLLAAFGGVGGAAAGGVVLWLGQALDCLDGEIARLRVEGSKLGEWLDSLADDVSTLAMLLGLGVGIAVAPWPLLGALGFGAGALSMGKIYWDLHHMGATIDSAQYPWFFGKPSEGRRPESGGMGRFFGAVLYLFRRDAYITVLALLLLLGARVPAFVILFAGTALFAALLVVHLLVRKPSP